MLNKVIQFRNTRRGHLVFAATEAVLCYIFASIAIDTANMFAYAAAILFFIGAITNLAQSTQGQKPLKKAHGRR
jgi:hypothetical protein